MSKTTQRQIDIIDSIKSELDYWATSNDIHSPSHGTSIAYEMLSNVTPDVGDDDKDEIEHLVSKMHAVICRMDPCKMRNQ
jgi:hypothetical protein